MNPWLLICGGAVAFDVLGLAILLWAAKHAPINPYEP